MVILLDKGGNDLGLSIVRLRRHEQKSKNYLSFPHTNHTYIYEFEIGQNQSIFFYGYFLYHNDYIWYSMFRS